MLSYFLHDHTPKEQADFIHDISTNPMIARQMAELFTAHQLASVHFRDVVEDMLP